MVHDKWRIMQWCLARLIEPADGHLHCVVLELASNKIPKIRKIPKGSAKVRQEVNQYTGRATGRR